MKSLVLQIKRKSYDYWVSRNWYFHSYLAAFYQFVIPKGARVLQVQCKNGYLLDAVDPAYGVGLETDSACIRLAQHHFPDYTFVCTQIDHFQSDEPFDYIILSSATMEADDIQDLLQHLQRLCHSRTRIVIDTYANHWAPILWLTQKLRLRRPTNLQNWLSVKDLTNLLHLADFELVMSGRQILCPIYIPFVSWFLNTIVATIPLIDRLCLSRWLIARPYPQKRQQHDYSVSVIVTARNEKGNIQAAIDRTPQMGKWTEIIFVEGGSTDDTLDEIKRVVADNPDKRLRYFVQDGKGKGDAVRKGFANAKGDILMILDGDLTTPPEEMPKFVQALVAGKGDFINGCRLIYGMENEAMQFLNRIANYLFGVGFSWLLSQPIKDTLCGTKVLFKKDYETIAANRSFFGEFDPFGDFDLLFGAAKQNFKIVDMPVHYKNRTYGQTNISRFRHGLILLYMSWVAFKKFKFK